MSEDGIRLRIVAESTTPQNQSVIAPHPRAGWLESLAQRQSIQAAVCSILLFFLVVIPRFSDLDALVTPDEPLWIARSANFYQAIDSGHFGDTYQYVHPGVPVMWLGAIGFALHIRDLPQLMDGQVNQRNRELQTVLNDHGYEMIDVLVDLRHVMIVATAIVVIAIFLCLSRLAGLWTAFAATVFLIFDPLHIGFTRLLHLDGFSANLLILAMIAFTWYQQTRSWPAMIVTGVSTGFALLTRSANGVLIPFFGLLTLVDVVTAWRGNRADLRFAVRKLLIDGAIIGGIAAASCVLLWPALWVNPIETLRLMWEGSSDLASGGAELNQFFRGSVTKGDPGWTYYPVILAYRLSPFTVFGLLFAAVAAVRLRGFGNTLERRLAANLTLFAAFYIVVLSFSAKKFDRYALPSILALDLVAALGWIAIMVWIARLLIAPSPRLKPVVAVGLVTVLLAGQTDLGLRAHPFYIDAASPLLGGTSGAQSVFSFNWGEGGKETAETLATIDGIDSATVVIGPWQATTDYYLPFQLDDPVTTPNLRGAAAWLNTDYIVVTYPDVQRQLYSPALLAWFDQHQPIAIVTDSEGVYARVFDIRNEPVPDAFYTGGIASSTWSDSAQIVAADFPQSISTRRTVGVTLYFERGVAARPFTISAQIAAPDGSIVGETRSTAPVQLTSTGISQTTIDIALPDELSSGRYTIRVTLFDAESGQPMTATNSLTGEPLAAPVRIGTFAVK